MTASFADNEIWHVMIADDMKRMNIDQLDDAFRLSVVDASTLVWTAGMKTWRRLGSIADLEDAEPAPHRAPPPPPRPLAPPPPARATPFSAAPAFPVSQPRAAAFAAAPALPAPARTMPLAPVYTPQFSALDVYALPRRAALESEVDFRRRSGKARWGRWLSAGLLLSVAVLAAYRQNLLRAGARSLGVEQKYLHGEMRVTSLVSKQAPPSLKTALERLGLLPGPNAAELAQRQAPTIQAPVAATPAQVVEEKPTTPGAAPRDQAVVDPEIKTVSLDSLPVLGGSTGLEKVATLGATSAPARVTPALTSDSRPSEPKPTPAKLAPKPAASEPRATPVTKTESAARQAPSPKAVAPVAKAEPPAHPASPPPPANESPLKAAIRMAIAGDSKK